MNSSFEQTLFELGRIIYQYRPPSLDYAECFSLLLQLTLRASIIKKKNYSIINCTHLTIISENVLPLN